MPHDKPREGRSTPERLVNEENRKFEQTEGELRDLKSKVKPQPSGEGLENRVLMLERCVRLLAGAVQNGTYNMTIRVGTEWYDLENFVRVMTTQEYFGSIEDIISNINAKSDK